MSWYRARFLANPDDYRPVKWPPPGPFWCTGYTGDDRHSVVVAYVRERREVRKFWPEAKQIEYTSESEITFTDRFPVPDWWPAAAQAVLKEGK